MDIDVKDDGWSKWYTPDRGLDNCIIRIGSFSFPMDVSSDLFTCRVDIEFKDVEAFDEKPFVFRTVGAVNYTWDSWPDRTLWNSSYIRIEDAPKDGVYRFEEVFNKTDAMKETYICDMSFRCDYWKSGSFRVRNVMIECGNLVSDWTPGM